MSGKLKETRERISSVSSTQQITKAMKMVSAAKLKKAQDNITKMRPYADRLNKMMVNIISNLDGDVASAYAKERPVNKIGVVVVSSNRGLAGAFNTNVGKASVVLMEELKKEYKAEQIEFSFIGKKGFDFLKSRSEGCVLNKDLMASGTDTSFGNISGIAQGFMDSFSAGDYDKVYVVYSQFKNAAVQTPQAVQFLPVPKIEGTLNPDDSNQKADYLFEPSKEVLLEQLIPSILQTTFHKFVLDTSAGEHGARMSAMDKATENANDLLRDLKIAYNKARQESITNEILEIVGGAAALDS